MQPPREETLRTLLGDLYPNDSSGDGQELSSQLLQILSQSSGDGDMAEPMDRWDGRDVVLITYADTIGDEGVPGLQALKSFVNRHLHPFAAVVHVLPFLQSTSDGGFAVASHTSLEKRFGDWSDLAALGAGPTADGRSRSQSRVGVSPLGAAVHAG